MAQALEYDFIEKPSEDYHCPVTLEILTEPHQTLCCGSHLSQEAADQLKRERAPCPMCKDPNLNTVPDKFFKRQFNQLKVWCSKKALGCNWVGELGDLEKHLHVDSVDGQCQYVAVACPLSCGDRIQRHLLAHHKSAGCPQRRWICKHCGHKATFKLVMEDHSSRCEKYPLRCPNNCGENSIERQDLQKHLDDSCPLQVIPCRFSYAGCEIECQRQEMQGHLDGNMQSHFTLVSEMTSGLQDEITELKVKSTTQQEKIEEQERMIEGLADKSSTQEKKIQSLTHQVSALASALNQVGGSLKQPASPVFTPPPDIVMTDFAKHKENGVRWFSPPFYSHIGGYKLCIGVDAYGWGDGVGTHVGVAIYMMRGKYDGRLKWPFIGEVGVQLLNQRGDKEHIEESPLNGTVSVTRVVGHDRAKRGMGYETFIAHSDLGYNSVMDCQYLMNDCLKFRVTKVELAP